MPAKLLPEVANELLDQFAKEKGVTFTTPFVNCSTPLRFLCTECGKETKITWGQVQQGKNPNMLCLDCSYRQRSKTSSLSYDELKAEIEAKGSLLLNSHEEKLNTHTYLSLICTYCGDKFTLMYGDYKRGRNKRLRCSKCAHIINGNYIALKSKPVVSHADNRQNTFAKIKSIVESKGSKLLTTFDEYNDINSYIRFTCSRCGNPYQIRWCKFSVDGQNQDLLCKDCLPEKKEYTTEYVAEEFKRHGTTLLNEYVNVKEPLLFNCTQCGGVASIRWCDYLLDKNKHLLCRNCLKGNISSDPNAISGTYSENGFKRNKAESRTREFCKTFFNLNRNIRGEYESHHIKPLKQFPDLQYSLGNLYPLPKEEHHTNNFTFYHSMLDARDPENWPDTAKLPYHDYDGFRFINLNKYLVTDYILEEDQNLLNKKKFYAANGILYIPLYFQEVDVFQSAFIVYSMIRSRLAKIPEIGTDIYKYTGQKFTRYCTRKLKICEVSVEDAFQFFEQNHIQGYINFSVCLGLYQDDKLVSAMSFGIPRHNKWRDLGGYEMLRFCSLLNSSVPGAASKLFKYFVDNYSPKLVVTFCDVRFSSPDPMETVYPKLGFTYDGYSKPNYKYYRDGELYSRQHFMKSKLEKNLEFFDPELSELQNMHLNGYVRLYDCGNFRYVWTKP